MPHKRELLVNLCLCEYAFVRQMRKKLQALSRKSKTLKGKAKADAKAKAQALKAKKSAAVAAA